MSAILGLARSYAATALREAALIHPGALPKGLKVRIELIEAGEFDDASEVRAVILALKAVEIALGGGLPSPLNEVRHD